MKVSPKVDFPIQVVLETDEREGDAEHLFEGIYRVILNHTISVAFIPDVSQVVPPWEYRLLPGSEEPLTTVEQARVLTAFVSPYVVTPNAALADSVERVQWPADEEVDASESVVFYVAPAEFRTFADELEELSEIVFSKWPDERVSDLRRFSVAVFLERRVADSGWLIPYDAALLGRAAPQ